MGPRLVCARPTIVCCLLLHNFSMGQRDLFRRQWKVTNRDTEKMYLFAWEPGIISNCPLCSCSMSYVDVATKFHNNPLSHLDNNRHYAKLTVKTRNYVDRYSVCVPVSVWLGPLSWPECHSITHTADKTVSSSSSHLHTAHKSLWYTGSREKM